MGTEKAKDSRTAMREKKILHAEIVIVFVIIGIVLLCQLLDFGSDKKKGENWTSPADLNGRTFVCVTTSDYVPVIEEGFPDAKILYVQDWADEDLFVVQGKADALVLEDSSIDATIEEYPELCKMPDRIGVLDSRMCTQKDALGNRLVKEIDEYVTKLQESGEMEEIYNIWKYPDNAPDHVDVPAMKKESKGTLRIVSSLDWPPMCYQNGQNACGYLIDLTTRFCAEYGYEPQFEYLDIQSAIAGFEVGRYDLLCYGMVYREEAAEEMNFTKSLHEEPLYVVVNRQNYAYAEQGKDQEEGPWLTNVIEKTKKSFIKNFVTEDRWRMLLSGLGVTVALSLLSGIFGTLLGALICGLRRSSNCYATAFARLYVKIIQGVPIMVLLMILYYIVFAKSGLTAFFVCVIGFSLDFAAYTSEIFRSGIEAVPVGQQRAAMALGFPKMQAFWQVVLPQAIVHILPVYIGQFISMVKMTSVAGYISVQDLTKMSDIIRSRTYEAFFPLLLSAVLYFLVAWVLTIGLKIMKNKVDPATRSRKVKGVEIHVVEGRASAEEV